jgi:hypothetical protein
MECLYLLNGLMALVLVWYQPRYELDPFQNCVLGYHELMLKLGV